MSGLPTPVDPEDPRAALVDVAGEFTEMHDRCHAALTAARAVPDALAVPARPDERAVAEAKAYYRADPERLRFLERRCPHAPVLVRAALARDDQAARPAGGDTAPQDVYAVVMRELDRLATPVDTLAERYMQAESVVRAIDAHRAAAGPRAGDTAPADAEAVVAWWSPSTRRFIVEHPGVGWLAIPSDGGAHRADYPADAVRLVADGSRAGDTAPDDIPDTRETFELLVPEPPTADVVEVRPRKWGDGPWCRDGMEWARGNYRLTWAQLLHKYSDRGVEVARRVEARDTSSADEPSCPDHGPGEHVTGQAFGAGREWFCTLCDDTFLWVRPTTAAAPVSDTSSTLRHLAGELRDGPPAWLPAGADTSWCGDVASWLEYHADQHVVTEEKS